MQDFVAGLTKSRKSAAKIKKRPSVLLTRIRPGGWPQFTLSLWKWKLAKPLTPSTISVPRKTKKTPDIVSTVAPNVKKDWPVICQDITFAYGGIQWDKAQHSLRKPRADQGMVLSLEQNSGPNSLHHADVDDHQQDPAASIPSLFAGSGSWGLLLLLRCAGGAGWHCLDSGELQEDLGRGRPEHWHWPVRQCLQAVVGLPQQLHLAQQWINQKIFRNKHPANYNHSYFIHVFQFDFEFTTYGIYIFIQWGAKTSLWLGWQEGRGGNFAVDS